MLLATAKDNNDVKEPVKQITIRVAGTWAQQPSQIKMGFTLPPIIMVQWRIAHLETMISHTSSRTQHLIFPRKPHGIWEEG